MDLPITLLVEMVRDDPSGGLKRYAAFSFFLLAELLCIIALLIPDFVRPGLWRVAFMAITVIVALAVVAEIFVRTWPRWASIMMNPGAGVCVAVALSSLADRGDYPAGVVLFGLPAIFAGMYLSWRHVLVQSIITVIGSTLFLWGGIKSPLILTLNVMAVALSIQIPAIALLLLRARLETILTRERTAALTDPLTGLANRRGLIEEASTVIARARIEDLRVVMAVGDIDHFKHVNDTFGHAVGDQVLRRIAHVLRTQVRPGDIVARLGGEEFGILLAFPEDEIVALGERLREAVALELLDLSTTISIGMAWTAPFDIGPDVTTDIWSLADSADARAYLAKRHGRNRVIFSEFPDGGKETFASAIQ